MPATTRLIGILLILLGIAGYLLTGRTSITALIPAFFGAVYVVIALVARGEAARKHAMHTAVALSLIGAVAVLYRALPAVIRGEIGRAAVISQLLMAALLL